jgi:uncharacterized protein YegL
MLSGHVLPIYLVCDQSFSMVDHIETLNDSLLEFHRAHDADPLLAELTRLCLIGFAESPEILLPLRRAAEITRISNPTGGAATNFGAMFAFLRETITRDLGMLKEQARQICRPAVFLLSDGQPTDPVLWPAAHARLVDPAWAARPNVIAFGIGDADPVTISRIGTHRAYLGRDGVSLSAALRELTDEISTFADDWV